MLKIAIIALFFVVMISLMKNKISELLMLIRRYVDKKQFNPSVDDIKDDNLEELANKLKGDSTKDIITNILEWQHNNILYWEERGTFGIPLLLLPIIFFGVYESAILSKNTYIILLPFLGAVWSIIAGLLIFITLLIIWLYFNGARKLLIILLASTYILAELIIINPTPDSINGNTGLINASIHGMLLGISIFTIIYLILIYLRHFRMYSIKPNFLNLLNILYDTFRFSLPVGKVINYRLAICRDFAKLTAALFFFNYPDSKVYFFIISSHVATAVKINDEGEYYIFDKKLPVLTKDGWLKKWNVTEANVYSSELSRNPEDKTFIKFKNYRKEYLTGYPKTKTSILKKLKQAFKSDSLEKNENIVNISELSELTDKVSKLLGINQSSHKEISDFDFTLENYAVYYENDDIVKYSLTRAIKNKLENEFCSNINKISKIEINQCENDKDLNLSVYL